MLKETVHNITKTFNIIPNSPLEKAVHFFIEDGFFIFFALYFVVFFISLLKKHFSAPKIQDNISNKNIAIKYTFAILLGIITPFCSCVAVPLFIGFVAAGIPFSIAVVFLISSAVINEVALFLILGVSGLKVFITYLLAGCAISVLGGYLCSKLQLEKVLSKKAVTNVTDTHRHHHHNGECCCEHHHHDHRGQEVKTGSIKYANHFALQTIKDTWGYILFGLVIGALMNGYMSESFVSGQLSKSNFLAVPLACLVGVFLYAPHGAVIPIFDSLIQNFVPLGTSLTALMSITAISIPEIIMLKKTLSLTLLSVFILYLFLSFIIVGYLINYIY